jgi:hypothetical protein
LGRGEGGGMIAHPAPPLYIARPRGQSRAAQGEAKQMAGPARLLLALTALTAAAFGAPSAQAKEKIFYFHAALDGKYGDAPTGSAAIGRARVTVDAARRRVSVDLVVDGITVDRLWKKLVAAPIGPIHLHKYARVGGGASVLVLPIPYGADYHATRRGMRVTMKDYDYAAGARLVDSTLSFGDFVAAMKGGLVILNIHTEAHNSGEISGKVVAD